MMTIQQQSISYRRGMVLGLTMAETMLLLVFCLLISAASVFSRSRLQQAILAQSNRDVQSELARTKKELQEANSTITLLRAYRPSNSQLNDEWERLVVKGAEAIQKLKAAGVDLAEAADAAPFLAQMMDAHKKGMTGVDVTGSIELGKDIAQEFANEPGGVPKAEEIRQLIRRGREAAKAGAGGHKWPPIITLSEADRYYFETGSAELSTDFRAALSSAIMQELLQNIEEFPDVNVIEVIGHTDEQRITSRPSNLDEGLLPIMQEGGAVGQLSPADNAGLGLARAVSVAQLLRADARLSRFSILPYSGAQVIDVTDMVPVTRTFSDVRERRRIEIRLRKSDKFGWMPVQEASDTTTAPKKIMTDQAPKPRTKQKPKEPSSPLNIFNW